MKKLAVICLSVLMVFALAACGKGGQDTVHDTLAESRPTTPASESKTNSTKDIEENKESGTVSGASRIATDGELFGNNQYIAQIIQRETGGDLFSIETVQDYPTTHGPLLEFAYNEKAEGARPELAAHIENPDDYNVIFLGFSNWNADLPMPLYTFLEEYDFSGKTIIPFVTHGGSGFSRTVQTIAKLQPNATVISDGLSISRDSVAKAESEVVSWVSGLHLGLPGFS